MMSKILLFLFILRLVASVSPEEWIVQTKVGKIRGTKATDGDYFQFMGIPYGKVDDRNPFGVSKYFSISFK